MYDSSFDSEPDMHYVFVYGTLRSACETGAHKQYLRGADFISPAKIRGQLFMVDYYPGLVLSETEHWAIGEIYLLEDEAQLHDLDVYEGCAKKSPQPHEYERRLTQVLLTSGESMNAWVYVYKQSADHLPLINSGDFLNK
jgi:gamma-glutamylcyclotransferase (GGCT)/AIG2-like uncharacterized protein YtfP